MNAMSTRQAGMLLTEVFTWCAKHPWNGGEIEVGDLTFQQHTAEDGTRTISVLGVAPVVMAFSTELLDHVDRVIVGFDHQQGHLILDVQPERLLYEPLYVGRRAEMVVFRRVCTRCHNSRKVPDWSQGLDPIYGEPKGKPCPECAGWEFTL